MRDVRGLVGLVQYGVLEFHLWVSAWMMLMLRIASFSTICATVGGRRQSRRENSVGFVS